VVDLWGSRSNKKGKEAWTGASGTQAVDPPLISIPPPREAASQGFVQSPVPVRVGNLGEKDTCGS